MKAKEKLKELANEFRKSADLIDEIIELDEQKADEDLINSKTGLLVISFMKTHRLMMENE